VGLQALWNICSQNDRTDLWVVSPLLAGSSCRNPQAVETAGERSRLTRLDRRRGLLDDDVRRCGAAVVALVRLPDGLRTVGAGDQRVGPELDGHGCIRGRRAGRRSMRPQPRQRAAPDRSPVPICAQVVLRHRRASGRASDVAGAVTDLEATALEDHGTVWSRDRADGQIRSRAVAGARSRERERGGHEGDDERPRESLEAHVGELPGHPGAKLELLS